MRIHRQGTHETSFTIALLAGLLSLLLTHLLDGVPDKIQIDHEMVETVRRVDQIGVRRRQIAEDLLKGRVSLSRAAGQFREISDELPYDYRTSIRSVCRPGVSDDELHFRHVMRLVEWPAAEWEESARLEPLRREMKDRESRGDWRMER